MSRDTNFLHPDLQAQASEFIRRCAMASCPVIITCTWRPGQEQEALWAQGRTPLDGVNYLRNEAGLAPITEAENKRTVTDAQPGQSKHENKVDDKPASKAFDCCPYYSKGEAYPAKNDPRWDLMGEIGEAIGLKWGGRFSKVDKPHFELKDE